MSIPGHPSTLVLQKGKAFASIDADRFGTKSHEKLPELDVSRYLTDIQALEHLRQHFDVVGC
eukprot:1574234-Amphidinium_carterae.1